MERAVSFFPGRVLNKNRKNTKNMLFCLCRAVKQKWHIRFCISISLTPVIQLSDLGLKKFICRMKWTDMVFFLFLFYFIYLAFHIFSLKKFTFLPWYHWEGHFFVAGWPGRYRPDLHIAWCSTLFSVVVLIMWDFVWSSTISVELSASLKWTSSENNFFPCFGSFSCSISSQPTCVDQKNSLCDPAQPFSPVNMTWGPALSC